MRTSEVVRGEADTGTDEGTPRARSRTRCCTATDRRANAGACGRTGCTRCNSATNRSRLVCGIQARRSRPLELTGGRIQCITEIGETLLVVAVVLLIPVVVLLVDVALIVVLIDLAETRKLAVVLGL